MSMKTTDWYNLLKANKLGLPDCRTGILALGAQPVQASSLYYRKSHPQGRLSAAWRSAALFCLHFACFFLCTLLLFSCTQTAEQVPEYKKWHTVTLSFEGPATSEDATPNPFTHYRLNVTFTQGNTSYTVPGFYAADGHAAESSAESGNIWKVRFTPDAEGEWTYQASFREGENIATSADPNAGNPLAFDGATGTFNVIASDKIGNDFRALGRLRYIGERYLQFADAEEYFLKGGADSPENLLAYNDFDSSYVIGEAEERQGEAAKDEQLHAYAPHLNDWKEGDPSWQGGKGKSLIGAMNYLASQGMNSVYFLTMNIGGDGKDVWPYRSHEDFTRFDCSKLDQWEVVFSHMDSLGLMLHFVTQETENETLLDGGATGPQRKLYYRELIARFAHHLAITWNMGEENGYADFTPEAQDEAQQRAMASYIKATDPYNNFVVIHTHSNPKFRYQIFEPLLGFEDLDGPSLQIGSTRDIHSETIHWIAASGEAGKQWVVCLDEIGPANIGVKPDTDDPAHDTVRHEALWGNLMAGGGGVEWYFGYQYAHNDLNAEDWRSRENMWAQTRHALEFFHAYLPFWEMETADDLTVAEDDYCFAKPGEVYAIYDASPDNVQLNLENAEGSFTVHWYDPRNGGEVLQGNVTTLEGGSTVNLGNPPTETDQDWAILVRKN